MSSVNVPVDEMTECAIAHLLGAKDAARALPYVLVTHFGGRPALEVVLAMSMAAQAVETVMGSARDREIAAEAWRMAALLAVDVHMVQVLDGAAQVLARDVLAHWQARDGFFLPMGPAGG